MDPASRLDFLKTCQNPDGGWGYFPGRGSWLEPTFYAMLALDGCPGAKEMVNRGWKAVRSWQLPTGAWRAGPEAADPHWSTALAVTLHVARGEFDSSFRAGVRWLLGTAGVEGGLWLWMAKWFKGHLVEYDPALAGWPWRPGNAAWVEPTAHTLISLKNAASHYDSENLSYRVSLGERMLIDRRCRDGGWNYGNRRIYRMDLPSYDETTAIALLGLRGCPGVDLQPSVNLALRQWHAARSPYAKAWLTICLRNYGVNLGAASRDETASPSSDVLVAALEALACGSGLYQLLGPEHKA